MSTQRRDAIKVAADIALIVAGLVIVATQALSGQWDIKALGIALLCLLAPAGHNLPVFLQALAGSMSGGTVQSGESDTQRSSSRSPRRSPRSSPLPSSSRQSSSGQRGDRGDTDEP